MPSIKVRKTRGGDRFGLKIIFKELYPNFKKLRYNLHRKCSDRSGYTQSQTVTKCISWCIKYLKCIIYIFTEFPIVLMTMSLL